MTLHTVGPKDMSEDERTIGKAYQAWLSPLWGVIPFAVAYYADTKWVIAVGFAVALPMFHEAGGRLHDLCIRLRRTNILLSERISS
jgi:hypothetical protein